MFLAQDLINPEFFPEKAQFKVGYQSPWYCASRLLSTKASITVTHILNLENIVSEFKKKITYKNWSKSW